MRPMIQQKKKDNDGDSKHILGNGNRANSSMRKYRHTKSVWNSQFLHNIHINMINNYQINVAIGLIRRIY